MKLSRFFDQVGLVPMISGIVSFWDAIVFAVWTMGGFRGLGGVLGKRVQGGWGLKGAGLTGFFRKIFQ